MTWTDTARWQHKREEARYPSDLRDGEWALIEPMFPAARSGGRPRTTCLRTVMDAIFYIASSGCAWRMLPKCFGPVSTVRGYFYAWRDSGLVMAARQQAGREASPSAGVIDSQSVKTTESGGVTRMQNLGVPKCLKDSARVHCKSARHIGRSKLADGTRLIRKIKSGKTMGFVHSILN